MLSITVTSTHDAATDGSLTTLIGAILAADGESGGDTIILPSNTTFTLSQSGYVAPLSGNGSVNTGTTLLPGINQPITIEGNGSTITLASGAVGRFFSIAGSLTLNDINLLGGNEVGGNGGGGYANGGGGAGLGGAIFVSGSSASLTLSQSSIANSSATGGAGATDQTGELTITDGGGGGGGLSGSGANYSGGSGGSGGGPNSGSGGASQNGGGNGGFGGGGGGGGGAVYQSGSGIYVNGGIGGAGGFGGGGGGAAYSPGTANPHGGAGGFGGGGGAAGYGPSAGAAGAFGGSAGTGMNNDEQDGGGGAGLGGAIFNYQGTVTLNNVSLVGNTAIGGGGYGTGSAAGGAVFNYSGTMTLNNGTIANNSTSVTTGYGPSGSAQGGGIYNYKASGLATPVINLYNTALTADVTVSASGTSTANDILNGSGGTVTANGANHNFIGAASGTISGNSVLSGAAYLDFPGLFGGYLMAPPEALSPLVGAGDPTTSLTVDETAATRSGTAPSIGAYEGALPSPFPLSGGSILVTDSSLGALLAIDPTTGIRQTISAANVIGTGPAFNSAGAVALDTTGNIYVAAASSAGGSDNEILEIDPTTGNRTLLSGNGTGTGTVFQAISDIAYDSATGALLVTDSGALAVYSVSTSTGNRTVLSNNTTPNSTHSFVGPTSILYNGTEGVVEGDEAFDSSSYDSALLKIAAGGARTIFSDDSTPNGTNKIGSLEGIANNSDGSILAIDDYSNPSGSSHPQVLDDIAITGTPGARTVLATLPATAGSDYLSEYGIAANASGIYVTQTGTLAADNRILQVSGSTVSELAGNNIGSGPYFGTGLNIGIAVVPPMSPTAPSVTTNPANTTMNSGGNTSFTAAATGYPTATEQWQISTDSGATFNNISNAGVYSGATSTTLAITGGTTSLSGDEYQVVFTNTPGTATSTAATLTVDFAPVVASNPTNQTINIGGNVSFTASATGLPVPSVQWQVSTNGGGIFTNITNTGVYSGATTGTLNITGASSAMNTYEYQAVFSNTLFGAGSASTATTTAATLTVNYAPSVSTNPSNTTVNAGSNTSLTSAATANPASTEQWQVSTDGGVSFTNITDGSIYSGTASATLSITATTSAMNGYEYRDVFTNTNGTATTTASTLTVDFVPAVTTNPSDDTINLGSVATFTAAATGSPTPIVHWQVSTDGGVTFNNFTNGGIYNGVATDSLTVAGTESQSGYEYRAVFANTLFGAGSPSSATTTASTLTVVSIPVVNANPTNATVNAGGNTSFTAMANSNPPPTEQWQVSTDGGVTFTNIADGSIYSGSALDTLSITAATPAMNGYEYRDVFTNDNGTATTTPSTLTVDSAPSATTNPANSTINTGDNTSFTVAAAGNPTPTVQWQVSTDGGTIFNNLTNTGIYGGVTTDTLTLTGATLSENGDEYEAVFSNTLYGAGSPTSITTTAATLTVNAAPVVGGNPTSTIVNAGGNTSFVSSATGYPVPTERWQVSTDGGVTFTNVTSGGVYGGATSATLSITGATAAVNGYQYRDVFTNTNGTATTTPSTLTVDFAPTLTTNPAGDTINTGASASFTAAATGNPTPTVQWQLSTDGGTTFNDVANVGIYNGVTTDTLTLSAATLPLNGFEYRAVFSNTLNGAGSASTATTTAATLTVNAAPVVGNNPTSATINAGGNTSFVSSATGYPLPTEQWQVSTDGGATFTNITDTSIYSGSASSTLSVTAATPAMNGYEYRDVFTNIKGTDTTAPSTLTVDSAPTVTVDPIDETIDTGSNTSFTVAATGNPTPSVQWQVSFDGGTNFYTLANGGTTSAVTTDTLIITGATLLNNGYEYRAIFSNTLYGAGSPSTATSTPATLTVNAAPVVGVSPTNAIINAGGTTSFASSATGYPVPTEQWQVSTDGGATFTNFTDTSIYSGSASSTLSITGATADMNGYEYRDVFTNINGTVTTTPSTLTVDFAPTVTANPVDSTIAAQSAATFTVAATGNPTPSVQWQFSGDGGITFQDVPNSPFVSGNQSDSLILTNLPLAANGIEFRAVFTNTLFGAGSSSTATTTAATLTVDAAPVVGINPISLTINAGDDTSLVSSATGYPLPTDQWQVSTDGGLTFTNLSNGGVYSGTTSATLSITGATADIDGYEYRNVFTNGSGTATTSASTLTVDVAPAVTTNPTDSTINTGDSTSFTVSASGNPTPTVQWQVSTDGGATFTDLANTGIYGGVASDTLTLTDATLADNGDEYQAVFTNTLFGAGSPTTTTTTSATLTVNAAPAIGVNPTSSAINAGGNTSFASSATGYPAPTEQWQVSTDGGVSFSNMTDTSIYSGTTTDTLSINGATPDLNGCEYRDVFTNGNGAATTTPSTLTVDFAPKVTTNPVNNQINAGTTASFTVAAASNPTASVLWQVSTDGGVTFSNLTNANGYSGVTTDTLTLTSVSLADNGFEYRAVFSNTLLNAGSPSTATTTAATLTVGTPVITIGAYAQLVSSTSNTGTLHVQAQQDGTDANLTYTWSVITQPSAVSNGHSVSSSVGKPPLQSLAMFSVNGTNSAKNTSVTFLAPGQYTLQVVASNGIQSASSQVQVTAKVKAAVTQATTQVSGVQTIGDGQSITGFVVTFNGPIDPTTAQNVAGYRVQQQSAAGKKRHILSSWFGTNSGNQTNYVPYKIGSAVYDSQSYSVTLTLAKPMAVKNFVGVVNVLGAGKHAVLDASGKPIDGDSNGKSGGNFSYTFRMAVAKNVTYQTKAGEMVDLSLSGPGQVVTLLPMTTKTPIVDLIDTDWPSSILTGNVRKGHNSVASAILDELNGTANTDIQLGADFHVNQSSESSAL